MIECIYIQAKAGGKKQNKRERRHERSKVRNRLATRGILRFVLHDKRNEKLIQCCTFLDHLMGQNVEETKF